MRQHSKGFSQCAPSLTEDSKPQCPPANSVLLVQPTFTWPQVPWALPAQVGCFLFTEETTMHTTRNHMPIPDYDVFVEGEEVMLKSGGPVMTVIGYC